MNNKKNSEENSDLIIFNEIKEKLSDQLNSINSLDSKSGITIALVGAFIAGIFNSNYILSFGSIFLIILISILSFSILSVFISIFARRFKKDPDPRNLIELYKEKSCSETIGQLIINYRDNYYENERSINIKKNLLNTSFILILISTLVIIIGIIMNIICKGVIK